MNLLPPTLNPELQSQDLQIFCYYFNFLLNKRMHINACTCTDISGHHHGSDELCHSYLPNSQNIWYYILHIMTHSCATNFLVQNIIIMTLIHTTIEICILTYYRGNAGMFCIFYQILMEFPECIHKSWRSMWILLELSEMCKNFWELCKKSWEPIIDNTTPH